MPETLSGLIERITFHNPDNGFVVLKVKVGGRDELVTVLGNLTMVTPGEHVEASGAWTIDREHGPQFKAQELKTRHPASAEGIERFLGSGAVKCVGPKLAERIVRLYKERTLKILEEYPEMLLEIRGISAERLKRIRQSWEEQRCVREIMVFLHAHGIGSARAVKIYRTYGTQAIAAIQANPYQLADEIRGIGFKTADELAKSLGLDPRSPHRARAAVRYTLQQLTSEGHCGFPEEGVVERVAALVDIEPPLVETAIEYQIAAEEVIREENEGQSWLFLTALHKAESGIAESIMRLASGRGHPLSGLDIEAAIRQVEGRLGLDLAESQREALRQACRHRVMVITGGPGVGKTTLVRSLLEIFEFLSPGAGDESSPADGIDIAKSTKGRPEREKTLKCILAAPTGRAAKRLAETTTRPAKTLHRLLEFDPASGGFKRNRQLPLKGDLFVLDETSMVDVTLAHQFLRAVPNGACVVVVGDVDQLPSVGPGTVLADLIASKAVPVVRLTEIFRQASQSKIVTAAYAVNQGRLPNLEAPKEELTDFYFTECEEPEGIRDRIVRLVRERIPERLGLDPLTDVQILTPMNRSLLGARSLNQALQEALNPARGKPEVQSFGSMFRVGDRVIQTVNNYDRDVFNGDLGVIDKIDVTDQELSVTFDGKPVVYDFGDLDELALAYVLTIHKSQGSEYPCVILPLHTQHFIMLQRNLLYTGITRGKKLVVLVGSKRAPEIAVGRQNTARRYTALKRRLQELQLR